MEARTVPFFVLSLLYLWPLVAEVIGGVKKTLDAKPARWEGYLNVMLLPFVVITAAIARPALPWMPAWYVVLAGCIVVDLLGFLAWWAACAATSRTASSPT